MDLARDARALLCDGPAEDGEADRAPCADEKQSVREQAQEVAAGDRARREHRREDVVQRREEHQGRAEREPAVEILAALVEALAEADEREQVQQCKCGQQARQRERRLRLRIECRQARAGGAQAHPTEEEEPEGYHDGVSERSRSRAAADERRGRDEDPREHAPTERGPCFLSVNGVAVQRRHDRERERRHRRDEETGAEQEIEPSTLDGVAHAREHGDDSRREGSDRLQDQPEIREVDLRLEVGIRDKQRQRGAEKADEQDLSCQPRLEIVPVVLPHVHSCRQIPGRR